MDYVIEQERLADRASDLVSHNGIARVFVTLDIAATPPNAELVVEFFNSVDLADIVDAIDNTAKTAADVFTIAGGSRLLGDAEGGIVSVTSVSAVAGENALVLTVSPIGDYASYSLIMQDSDFAFDPLLNSVKFRFRPGCFNTNCAPLSDYQAASDEPVIDYLAKDYHSFKHVLMNAMRERVPDWQPTSEADMDQVLIDLIAADADELSDFQDRVMNEAWLGRARKRVSLARYGRLMDYHIHQGNQASTWLALKVSADTTLDRMFGVWSGSHWSDVGAVIYASTHSPANSQPLFAQLNELRLYTWGNVITALDAGSSRADIIDASGSMSQSEADDLRDLLRRSDVSHLLIEQKLNPETGAVSGVDKSARQVVQLLDGDAAAESLEDPVEGTWFVRVHWRAADALRRRFCFVTTCSGQPPEVAVSVFHGNMIRVSHGRPHRTVFRAPATPLDADDESLFERLNYRHYQPLQNQQLLRGTDADSSEVLPTVAVLPQRFLAYLNTAPGGDVRTQSTLTVEVSGSALPWDEQPDLIESADDDHFVVETDENRQSRIVFGNNINGRALPENAEVSCRYQIGRGIDGNIGPDALTGFDASATGFPAVTTVWNPLDATDGRDPEPKQEIIRRVPESYRARQLRAVTLEDYAKRAEELPAVSHAVARYMWTGSWRTVRVSIDLKAGYDWIVESPAIKRYLDAVRLIGEDLEVREARFVPVDIYVQVCAHPHYWPQDLQYVLAQEFSAGYTADGRSGFFHADNWTFGQALHASQIIGRALAVTGVDRVLSLGMRRWFAVNGAATDSVTISPEDLLGNETRVIEVEPVEIIVVASDPDNLERGRIRFDVMGGRG
jgi:hypothetical protein